jgi:hypothetical protein
MAASANDASCEETAPQWQSQATTELSIEQERGKPEQPQAGAQDVQRGLDGTAVRRGDPSSEENHEMAAQKETKTITLGPDREELAPEFFGQRKRPERGQFRLQVDRQLKASYTTSEAAEAAGLAIKKAYPILQVVVHDAAEGVHKTIELPSP